jgi:hypothetical protein
MSRIARTVLAIGQCFALALLPSPERDRLARSAELDAPICSFLFGLVQGGIGVATYMIAGLAFMRASSMGVSMWMLENWWPGLTNTHMAGGAVVSWLVWLVHPVSWPFAYLALVGLLRVAAFAITREAVGEPLVWAGLRLGQGLWRWRAARREVSALGPPRRDRVVRRGRGWLIISARPKDGWDTIATVEIDDDFYSIVEVERQTGGRWDSIVYHLEPLEDQAIIRRLVQFKIPAADGSSARDGQKE